MLDDAGQAAVEIVFALKRGYNIRVCHQFNFKRLSVNVHLTLASGGSGTLCYTWGQTG